MLGPPADRVQHGAPDPAVGAARERKRLILRGQRGRLFVQEGRAQHRAVQGAANQVGVRQRGHHGREPARVGDVVGVAEAQPFAGGRPDPGVAGDAGGVRGRGGDHTESGQPVPPGVGDRRAVVGGAVVHHDQLPCAGVVLSGQRVELVAQGRGGVADRKNHTDHRGPARHRVAGGPGAQQPGESGDSRAARKASVRGGQGPPEGDARSGSSPDARRGRG